jgi:hypothetical protein
LQGWGQFYERTGCYSALAGALSLELIAPAHETGVPDIVLPAKLGTTQAAPCLLLYQLLPMTSIVTDTRD